MIIKAFDDFDTFLHDLGNEPVSLKRNVTMMLACKLFNHGYSGLILAESGLIVDSILCERNALETIAFHWLVRIDEKSAEEYLENDTPRPVEVRKRLEKYGVDINSIKELYASGSQATHVGRDGERFQSQWATLSEGKLFFGGAFLPKDQSQLRSTLGGQADISIFWSKESAASSGLELAKSLPMQTQIIHRKGSTFLSGCPLKTWPNIKIFIHLI